MYKLTVILCVFNEDKSLFNALRSLYNNKIFQETEVVIVDDCSTNAFTIRALELLRQYSRFKIIRSAENKGLSNSRNLGFANATTNFVLPLDADDDFPESTLDLVYQTFNENGNIDFIGGNYFLFHQAKKESTLVDCSCIAINGQIDAYKLSLDWKLLGTSPCKKDVWQKVGGYSLKYSYSVQDVDFWIKVILSGAKGLFLPSPIYNWYKSETGMNATFDRIDMIKLLSDHTQFYLLSHPKQYLFNKIFEGYYPYKQAKILIVIGARHFWHLTIRNKLRLASIIIKTFYNKISLW